MARGGTGEKKKNEAVSNKMKMKGKENRGKEKEEKEKGRVIFLVNLWHTFVDYCILT